MLKTIGIILLVVFLILVLVNFSSRRDFERAGSVLNKLEAGEEYIDRAYIVEGSEEALKTRLNLMDQCESTLDLAYYKIDNGPTSHEFIEKVLETADRGVRVRIYLDGVLNNLKGDKAYAHDLFSHHPHIEYRQHYPLFRSLPLNLNNRLHDKLMLVDGRYGLIGGRNIGDRFFVTDYSSNKSVFDRDVLIYNENLDAASVIRSMEAYYNSLWDHKGSFQVKPASNRKLLKANKARAQWAEKIRPGLEVMDLAAKTQPIKRLELVHNDLYNKEDSICLQGVLELSERAKREIIYQSPYIIINYNGRKTLEKYDIDYSKINILTNSYYSTPNVMAVSGYSNIRKKLVDQVANIYEYHGGNSIHGKSYIFDEEVAIIGSFNLDPRSSYLSTEAYLVFYDEDFSRELKSHMEDLCQKSLRVDQDYGYGDREKEMDSLGLRLKVILIKILAKLTYFFDNML